jgi:hypothetical protein
VPCGAGVSTQIAYSLNECGGLWVLKKSAPFWSFWGLNNVVASVLTALTL